MLKLLSEAQEYKAIYIFGRTCATYCDLVNSNVTKLFKPKPEANYLKWYYLQPFGQLQLDKAIRGMFHYSIEAIQNMANNNIPNQFNQMNAKPSLLREQSFKSYKVFETLFGLPILEPLVSEKNFTLVWYIKESKNIRDIMKQLLMSNIIQEIDIAFGIEMDIPDITRLEMTLQATYRFMNTLLIHLHMRFVPYNISLQKEDGSEDKGNDTGI